MEPSNCNVQASTLGTSSSDLIPNTSGVQAVQVLHPFPAEYPTPRAVSREQVGYREPNTKSSSLNSFAGITRQPRCTHSSAARTVVKDMPA